MKTVLNRLNFLHKGSSAKWKLINPKFCKLVPAYSISKPKFWELALETLALIIEQFLGI